MHRSRSHVDIAWHLHDRSSSDGVRETQGTRSLDLFYSSVIVHSVLNVQVISEAAQSQSHTTPQYGEFLFYGQRTSNLIYLAQMDSDGTSMFSSM